MKNKEILKKIILILGFIIIISANVFTEELLNLDEIWIYNFGRNIFDGLIPYRDFNIIITPLFPYVCAFFLKIFGNEMIVLRIAKVIEITIILFMIYKILERLDVKKSLSCIFTLGIYYLYSQEFYFDYNWTVLLITLIVLFIELKNSNELLKYNFKKDFFLGILVRNNNSFKTNNWYYIISILCML